MENASPACAYSDNKDKDTSDVNLNYNNVISIWKQIRNPNLSSLCLISFNPSLYLQPEVAEI